MSYNAFENDLPSCFTTLAAHVEQIKNIHGTGQSPTLRPRLPGQIRKRACACIIACPFTRNRQALAAGLITRPQDGALVAMAKSGFVCFDYKNARVVPMPAAFHVKFDKVNWLT
jgi:hypothetical protein